jgi:hypothetical protein
MRKDLYKVYYQLVEETNAENMKLVATLFNVGNGLKVYEETHKALINPLFLSRKKDFEEKFKNAVLSNTELNNTYGDIWNEISQNRKEAASIAKEIFALTIKSYYSPEYFFIAKDLVDFADQIELTEEERNEQYRTENLDSLIENIFPANFNKELEDKKLLVQLNIFKNNLPQGSPLLKIMLNGLTGIDAVENILSRTKIKSKKDVIALAKSGAESIHNSDDPFIRFIMSSKQRLNELQTRNKKLDNTDEVNNQLLGEALYKVYGDEIPPDATGTLRISDGLIKGYDYNGTRAPYKTTFYGSLDRYYSFDRKFPFNLPLYWEDLPETFDLSTPLNFVSTCDIIGGNSGSPVINMDAEVVGLAFDGNIESHSGRYIYTTEANRTVSVSAEGMVEAIRYLYKAERLADEILNSRID